MKPEDFIMLPIPADRYTDVCALLGGAAQFAVNTVGGGSEGNAKGSVSSTAPNTEPTNVRATSGSDEQPNLSQEEDSGEVDAHGHPWNAELHASTKGKTKEGLWRMKPGATRPDPLPGFPVESADTGMSAETSTPSATSPDAPEAESAPAATSTEEDDEFAAFRDAAAKSDATDEAAAASVPARTYSDADLGALCNAAAVKLGDPSPVKELIAQYVPEGQVAHSRNIPEDKRAEFVAAVEAKAGIEFAG